MKTTAEVWIPLTQGKVTVIDFADFEKVRGLKWSLHGKYARHRFFRRGPAAAAYLHRFLLDAPKGLEVDHIDGDGLNNRRGNLRLATKTQNMQNGGVRKNPSGFKGVHLNFKKWVAQITVNGKKMHLGCFLSVEDAARAYDAAARKYFGEYASCNFSLGEAK